MTTGSNNNHLASFATELSIVMHSHPESAWSYGHPGTDTPSSCDSKSTISMHINDAMPTQDRPPAKMSLFVESNHRLRELRTLLERNRSKYTYYAATQIINVIAPTFVHSACTRWFAKWGEWLNDFHTSDDKEIEVLGEATLEKFYGDYEGCSKVPDAALYPQGRRMPTVVLEAGYTESYTQLLRDATLLLEGSGSRISYVILVKVSVLKHNERSITRAFVELHTLDPISNTRIKVSRNYLDGSRIQLPWDGILRNHLNDYENLSPPPPLNLRSLQRILNHSAQRYQNHREDWEDEDSESEWF